MTRKLDKQRKSDEKQTFEEYYGAPDPDDDPIEYAQFERAVLIA